MLYYIFQYLDKAFDVPGAGVFQYITFRSALAFIMSLLIATIYGKKIINFFLLHLLRFNKIVLSLHK